MMIILHIFLISACAFLAAVCLKVLIGDWGPLAAFGAAAVAFGVDFASTMMSTNRQARELNPLVRRLDRHTGFVPAMLCVGGISLLIQYTVYVISGDLLLSYMIIVFHAYAAIHNFRTQNKARLKTKTR